MKLFKWGAIAALATVAAIACFGAGSASAWSFCKKPEVPCSAGNLYNVGQVFAGALQEGTTARFTGGTEVICKTSTYSDTLVTASGSIEGRMEPVGFSNCNATVAAIHVPWKTEHIALKPGVWELNITSAGSGEPGVSIGECEYTSPRIELILEDTSVTGGAPRVTASIEALTGGCGTKLWSGTYRETPTNLYAG